MADWVDCYYTVTDTPSNIEMLAAEFEAAKKHNDEPFNTNGFGDNWLGNLLLHIGYSWKSIVDGTSPNCRGQISQIWIEGAFPNTLRFDTETAWMPMHECVCNFVRFFCPDAEIDAERTEVIYEEL